MTLGNFLWPLWHKQNEEIKKHEQEKNIARSALASAVVTLERRSNSVTRIAEDAIKSMHRS